MRASARSHIRTGLASAGDPFPSGTLTAGHRTTSGHSPTASKRQRTLSCGEQLLEQLFEQAVDKVRRRYTCKDLYGGKHGLLGCDCIKCPKCDLLDTSHTSAVEGLSSFLSRQWKSSGRRCLENCVSAARSSGEREAAVPNPSECGEVLMRSSVTPFTRVCTALQTVPCTSGMCRFVSALMSAGVRTGSAVPISTGLMQ